MKTPLRAQLSLDEEVQSLEMPESYRSVVERVLEHNKLIIEMNAELLERLASIPIVVKTPPGREVHFKNE